MLGEISGIFMVWSGIGFYGGRIRFISYKIRKLSPNYIYSIEKPKLCLILNRYLCISLNFNFFRCPTLGEIEPVYTVYEILKKFLLYMLGTYLS